MLCNKEYFSKSTKKRWAKETEVSYTKRRTEDEYCGNQTDLIDYRSWKNTLKFEDETKSVDCCSQTIGVSFVNA